MTGSTQNKIIVKNTFLMYVRMFFVMAITLYTSRVVLQVLGVDDFGIYNVVGGFIVLFSFINLAMATSTQRYFSYEIGRGTEGDVSRVFTACLRIHLAIAGIVLLLAETVGLWFINCEMNFPEGSMTDVNWVYQFSVAAAVLTIVRVPYHGLVISYERMGFFAVNSIVENVLKLVIVFILIVSPFDKLVFYAFLTLLVTGFTTAWFAWYCRKAFPEVRYRSSGDNSATREIVAFSGWSTMESGANVGYQQGVDIILNIGYGVVINAATAIATKVSSAVLQFVVSFQQALNPQLIQSESRGDRRRQESLIFSSAKFSFLIMLIIAAPVIINMSCVLDLWLGDYPRVAVRFSQLIVLGSLLECISGPLWVTIYATGKIRAYQILISLTLLLNVPLAYVIARTGLDVSLVFVVRIFVYVAAMLVRLAFLKQLIGLSLRRFARMVFMPLAGVTLPLAVFGIVWLRYVGEASGFAALLWQTAVIVSVSLLLITAVGLTRGERVFVRDAVRGRLCRQPQP